MSDETDRLADMGSDQEAEDFFRDNEEFCRNGRGLVHTYNTDSQKRKNRDQMRAKRRNPAYREAERVKNRERMKKVRARLTNAQASASVVQ